MTALVDNTSRTGKTRNIGVLCCVVAIQFYFVCCCCLLCCCYFYYFVVTFLLLLFCCTLAFLVVDADCVFDISCRCWWLFGIFATSDDCIKIFVVVADAGWLAFVVVVAAECSTFLAPSVAADCSTFLSLLLTARHFLLLPLTDLCFLPFLTTV